MIVHPETPLEMLFNVIITVLGNNCGDKVEIESDDDAQKLFILMKIYLHGLVKGSMPSLFASFYLLVELSQQSFLVDLVAEETQVMTDGRI